MGWRCRRNPVLSDFPTADSNIFQKRVIFWKDFETEFKRI